MGRCKVTLGPYGNLKPWTDPYDPRLPPNVGDRWSQKGTFGARVCRKAPASIFTGRYFIHSTPINPDFVYPDKLDFFFG